jgi:Pyruvate/2-oxoacid:ferredoxin oxidoreductase delta subunit
MAVEAVGVRIRRDSFARVCFFFTLILQVSKVGKIFNLKSRSRSRAKTLEQASDTFVKKFTRRRAPCIRHFDCSFYCLEAFVSASDGEIYTTRAGRARL